MKYYRNITACAALVLGAALGVAQAQTAGENVAIAAEQPITSGKVIQTRLERLTQELGLTPEQRGQVASILKDERAALKLAKADTTMTEAVRRAKRREIRSEHNERIRGVLNAEQQLAFERTLTKKKKPLRQG